MARSIAVVVGIPDFPEDVNTSPVKFAYNDALLFQDRIAAKFQKKFPVGPGQGLFATQLALNQGLLEARKGDTVFLFLSTRGLARPGSLDGYIGAADFVSQKKESSGFTISYLQQLIEHSDADRVLIFADLSREPAQPGSENRINIKLAELSGKISKPIAGILATGPRQFSKEDPNLSADGQKGFGVFGYYLVDSGARSPGGGDLPYLFGQLLNGMPKERQQSQHPRQFGNATAGATPLWPISSISGPSFRRYPLRSGVLIASADSGSAAASFDETPAEARLASLQQQLEGRRAIQDPLGLARSIRDLQGQVPSETWEEARYRTLPVLADAGQVCISRYGMQDLLPNDPLRVLDSEFAKCADSLAGAALLLPQDAYWQPYREMLRVRELFCRARPNLANSLNLLQEASAHREFAIPEIDDALGIYWLQSQQPDRYARAEISFKRAKLASPGWLYPRHNLALVYSEQGDMRSAEREYREAVAVSPVQPYVYYNYGLILERLNRLNDARKQYDNGINAYEAAIRLLTERATEWAANYPEQSALARRRAVVFRSAEAEVYNASGSLLEAGRDMSGARDRYQKARDLDRTLCPPAYNLARIELELVTGPAGIKPVADQLRQSVQSCSTFTPAHLLLADMYRRQGNLAEARAEYEEVIRLSASSIPALLGVSTVEDAQNHFDSALSWLDKAVSALLGSSELSTGRPGKIYPMPENQALYKSLGERYRDAGRFEACRYTYELGAAAQGVKPRGRELEKMGKICGNRTRSGKLNPSAKRNFKCGSASSCKLRATDRPAHTHAASRGRLSAP